MPEKIPLVDYITQYFEGGVERGSEGIRIARAPKQALWQIADHIFVVVQEDEAQYCRCGYPAPLMFVRTACGEVHLIHFCVRCTQRWAEPLPEPRYYRIEWEDVGEPGSAKYCVREKKIYEDEALNASDADTGNGGGDLASADSDPGEREGRAVCGDKRDAGA